MSWALCSSYAAVIKAGAYANSTVISSLAFLDRWSDESEAEFCTKIDRDLITSSAALKTPFHGAMRGAVAGRIAKQIIVYDMSGYPSMAEAQMRLNVVHNEIVQNEELLKDSNKKIWQ